jgi:FMN phosphatase YigB (HAD superfamily)
MSKISAVFFDFDGVLCTDRFYSTLIPAYPHIVDWIGNHIFSGEKYCDRWMRGEFTYRRINQIISNATGIPLETLNDLFVASVRQMTINSALIKLAEKLKGKHIKTALVTNNMDVFNEITIPEKELDKTFPVIVNSYNFKMMKQDENGRLFDIALNRLGLSSYEGVLLIDDSIGCCAIFKQKGGEVYQYSNQNDFEEWLTNNFY